MPNGMYGGVRGRKTKVGRKLLRFPPTRLLGHETCPCDPLIFLFGSVFFFVMGARMMDYDSG